MGYIPLQFRTDFAETDEDLYRHMSASMFPMDNMRHPANQFKGNLDIEALADKLWEKLNSKPVIIACPYCKSHNAVTNPTCVQCGGPLGAE